MRALGPACGLGRAWEWADVPDVPDVRRVGGEGCGLKSVTELSRIFCGCRKLSQARINILKIYVFQSSWGAKSDLIGSVIPIFTSDACLSKLLPGLDAVLQAAVPMHRSAWVTYSVGQAGGLPAFQVSWFVCSRALEPGQSFHWDCDPPAGRCRRRLAGVGRESHGAGLVPLLRQPLSIRGFADWK